MMALAERVLEEATRQGAVRVTAIHLKVGSLAGVDPEALRCAANVVLADSCAEGALLELEVVSALWWCGACSREFPAADGAGLCATCGHPGRELLRGRELLLHALDLEP